MVGFASSDRAYKAGPVAVLSPTHDPWGWPLATEHAAPSPEGDFLNRAVFRQPWAGVYIQLALYRSDLALMLAALVLGLGLASGRRRVVNPPITDARSVFFVGRGCVLA